MSRSSAGVGGLVVANVLITIVRIYDAFIEAVLDGQSQSVRSIQTGDCNRHVSPLNRFKGNVEETSERRGGAHMGLSERIDTILN